MFNRIIEFFNWLRSNATQKPEPTSPVVSPESPIETVAPFVLPELMLAWRGIVWHHSSSVDNPAGNDWDSIRKFHTSYRVDGKIVSSTQYAIAVAAGNKRCEKPWADIGYHLGIERNGDKLVVKIGRPWDEFGAHSGLKGNDTYNKEYLGCCLIGSFDVEPPDEEMMSLCIAVTKYIMDSLLIPKENVIGHREVYDRAGVPRQKTCPGSAFDLELFRSKL